MQARATVIQVYNYIMLWPEIQDFRANVISRWPKHATGSDIQATRSIIKANIGPTDIRSTRYTANTRRVLYVACFERKLQMQCNRSYKPVLRFVQMWI
jgi:hypothetical protein